MKYLKSESTVDLESLPKGKAMLSVKGGDRENIWVAKDEENKKMYLLNHSLNLYPFPSWGAEFDLVSSLDLDSVRGNTPDDLVLTIHSSAYENYKSFIDEDGSFNPENYEKAVAKEEAKGKEEEKNV